MTSVLTQLLCWIPAALTAQAPARTVAFTFDDLPVVRFRTVSEAGSITTRLLTRLRELNIPAVGFVNEGKLGSASARADSLTRLLDAWLEAGHDLGNHTFSHIRLFDVPLEQFEADVLRGQQVTARLLAARGRKLRYFRHPTLNTGPNLETKQAFEEFLIRHGYTVAPVTVDNDEHLYALAYDRARARADSVLMERIAVDYVRYMDEIFGFFEGLSRRVLNREPAQILLLHSNALNADMLDRLAHMIAGRGYRIVTLQQALTDSAYRHPDRYIGSQGPSWLIRWAVTDGLEPESPPEIPDWVRAAGRS